MLLPGGASLTLEVAVVERDTDAVETEALEERSIRVLKEILKELHSFLLARYIDVHVRDVRYRRTAPISPCR